MNSQTDPGRYSSGPDGAFTFDRNSGGVRFSADLGRLCQQVGEQVHNAVAEIDFEGIGEEVRRAMMEVGNEVREAVDTFNREQQRARGARVNVDVQYEPAAAATAAPSSQEALIRERTAVLQMVAAGKITPDQAERLLDALGG